MRREADILDFGKRLTEIQATMATPSSGALPIRLSASDAGYRMFGVPTAAHPDVGTAVTADLTLAAASGLVYVFVLHRIGDERT